MPRDLRLEAGAQIGRDRNVEMVQSEQEPGAGHGEPLRLCVALPAHAADHPLQPISDQLPARRKIDRVDIEVPIKRYMNDRLGAWATKSRPHTQGPLAWHTT